MKIKFAVLSIVLISFFFQVNGAGFENKIILKINNQIVTSLDLENEINYLLTLNPNLKTCQKKKLKNFKKIYY